MQEVIHTVADLIAALDGPTRTGALAGGASPQAVVNWRARNRIPPRAYFELSRHVKAIGKRIDPALAGLPEMETTD